MQSLGGGLHSVRAFSLHNDCDNDHVTRDVSSWQESAVNTSFSDDIATTMSSRFGRQTKAAENASLGLEVDAGAVALPPS